MTNIISENPVTALVIGLLILYIIVTFPKDKCTAKKTYLRKNKPKKKVTTAMNRPVSATPSSSLIDQSQERNFGAVGADLRYVTVSPRPVRSFSYNYNSEYVELSTDVPTYVEYQ
jgi:hypothetical protein